MKVILIAIAVPFLFFTGIFWIAAFKVAKEAEKENEHLRS